MLCACNVLKLQSNHVYPHVQINGHSHKLTILKYPHEITPTLPQAALNAPPKQNYSCIYAFEDN